MREDTPPTIAAYLPGPLEVGEPDVSGSLTVFPLFGAPPRLEYRAFAQAVALGAAVTELPGASVNDLVVVNPTSLPVLLCEGEELIGAQQNRTLDASVLVAAGTKLTVPVSCVERGRWDDRRHGEALLPAPQSAHPGLRRLTNRRARARVLVGAEPRAVQGEVWDEVAAKARRLGVAAPTEALHDIFEDRRAQLGDMARKIALRDGQTGMLAAFGGHVTVLDAVGRPDVFAVLHPPLVQSYALDALEALPAPAPPRDAVHVFVAALVGARPSERDAIGLGRDVRFGTRRLAGAALVNDGELIQISAFAELPPTLTRVHRPSRRRRAA